MLRPEVAHMALHAGFVRSHSMLAGQVTHCTHWQRCERVQKARAAAAVCAREPTDTSTSEQQRSLHYQQQQQQQLLHPQIAPPSAPQWVCDAAAAALTRQLKAASSLQQLVQLVQQCQPSPAAATEVQHYPFQQQQQQQQQQQRAKRLGRHQHQQLVALQQQHLAQWNPQHLSALLSALVKLQPPPPPSATPAFASAADQQHAQLAQAAFSQALAQLSVMRPRELSMIIWTAAKLQQPPPAAHIKQLLTQLASPAVLVQANAQDISMCLYATAVLGLQVAEAQVEALLAAAAEQLPTAAPQALANTLWAVASLQYRPSEDWLLLMEQRCCFILEQQQQQQQRQGFAAGFTAEGLHQLLWSMAKLQWMPNQQFLDLFWAVSANQLHRMTPHGTSGLLWAAATLDVPPPGPWITSWLHATQLQLQQGQFCDQDVANALWGVVKVGVRPGSSWLAAARAGSQAVLSVAGSQELANMLWGWAKLGVKPDVGWMQGWMQGLERHMGSYCAPALAASAYALAVLRFKPSKPWTEALLYETQIQMAAFGAQELSNLVWALAELGLSPSEAWFRDFLLQALAESGSFNAQELSLVCWSLAKLRYVPPAEWVAQLLRDGLEVQGGLNGQSLVLLMGALAAWRMPELRSGGKYGMLLPRYWAASQQLLPSCSLSQLSRLWWARARLGFIPHKAWVDSFWAAATPALAAATAAAAADAAQQQLGSGSSSSVAVAGSEPQAAAAAARQSLSPVPRVQRPVAMPGLSPGSTLNPADVIRLVWCSGKFTGQGVPPDARQLLLTAAELVVPSCNFAGLAALGMGLLGVERAAAAAAGRQVAQNTAAQAATVEGRARQSRQETAFVGSSTNSALQELQQQGALWQAWFNHSTRLLQQDMARNIQQQQQPVRLESSNTWQSHQQQQQQPQQPQQRQQQPHFSRVTTRDLSLQLSVAAQLGLRPPEAWSAAVINALTVRLDSMSLEQLSWVLWAVRRLKLDFKLPPGWLLQLLHRCRAALANAHHSAGIAGGVGNGLGRGSRAQRLRLHKALVRLRRLDVKQRVLGDAEWVLWLQINRQWCNLEELS